MWLVAVVLASAGLALASQGGVRQQHRQSWGVCEPRSVSDSTGTPEICPTVSQDCWVIPMHIRVWKALTHSRGFYLNTLKP